MQLSGVHKSRATGLTAD